MHTVKKGGAFFNTAVSKAKVHAKRGIRDIKGRLKAREEDEDGMTVCAGSPTSTKSLSPRRLQKMRRHNLNKSPMCMDPRDLGYGLDDDEDTASKISSEDSADVHSYTEDSDDSNSLELYIDSAHSGQMNLLEEILDSLTTTSMDEGKLSTAKSLDFFRSMDDLDYKAPKSKPAPCSECRPVDESSCGTEGDHMWNMGQDDSAVHGKHLPPSPRRQPMKSSLKVSKRPPACPEGLPVTAASADVSKSQHPPPSFSKSQLDPNLLPPGRQLADHRFSYSPMMSHKVTPMSMSPPALHTNSSPASKPSSPPVLTSRPRTISDPQSILEPPSVQRETTFTSIQRRNVLTKDMVKNFQDKSLQRQNSRGAQVGQVSPTKNSQASTQVPWEKQGSKEGLLGLGQCLGSGSGKGQDSELLEEIESMCCFGSGLDGSLQLSQVHCNNSRHQAEGKASDKS